MARLLSVLSRERLGKYFFPLSIAGVILTLFAVQQLLSVRFVVFGLYGLFGLAGGAAVYYRTNDVPEVLAPTIDERSHSMGVYIASAVSLGAVALTGEPLLVVAGLGVGYALVVRQMISRADPTGVVPQLTVLFLLSPLTKYLTAGRYFGHGDLLIHTRIAEDILLGRSVGAISYSSYYEFPGLHLVATAISSLTGLTPYDGLMLTGIGAYVVVIPAVYLVAVRLTDNPMIGLSIAFATAVLDDLSFYVSYAFPQSLAMVLLAVLAVLAIAVGRDELKWPATVGFTLVALALSFTHHLTQVLALPVVLTAAAIYAIRQPARGRALLVSRQAALFGIAVLISGLRFWQANFYDRLLRATGLLVAGGPIGGYTRGVTREFGAVTQTSPTFAAFEWLASPYGVYGVLLLMVFSIGLVGLLRSETVPTGYGAVAWSGVLGAVIIFESPLSIQSLIRIRAPWLFAFAFVVGLGVYQFNRYSSATGTSQLLLVLLVVLASIGPLVAADNYYGLDPRPTAETSFSDQQVQELRATARFVERSGQPTTAFWQTRLAMDRFRISGIERAELRDDRIFLQDGFFVYRSQWPEHKLTFTVGAGDSFYANTLYLSDQWLTDRVDGGNQVYSAGGTGILWQPTERTLASGAPANDTTASTDDEAGSLVPADESTPTETESGSSEETATETETPVPTETPTEVVTDSPSTAETPTETDSIFQRLGGAPTAIVAGTAPGPRSGPRLPY